MNDVALWRRLLAELLGSAFLAAVVIGSGIAAQRLSPGVVGLELLENATATATAAGLFAIILMFGPVSGGHVNPVVSFADAAFGAYIGAAYFFTSSTSFANPAITIGRMLSDTFAGTAPSSVPAFIAAQIIGGALAIVVIRALYPGVTPAEAADIIVPHHRDWPGPNVQASPVRPGIRSPPRKAAGIWTIQCGTRAAADRIPAADTAGGQAPPADSRTPETRSYRVSYF